MGFTALLGLVMSELNPTTAVVSFKKNSITEQQFNELPLADYGLKPEDMMEVLKITDEMSEITPQMVSDFGKGISKKTSQASNELLGLVQSKQMDETGQQLASVLVKAQSINTKNLVERPKSHGIPIIGSLIAKFSNTKQAISNNFNSVKESIDKVVVEIDKNQVGLSKRINMLDQMFDSVTDEYHDLGVHIASGLLVSQKLDEEIEFLRTVTNDPMSVQRLSDFNQIKNNLNKRISDLQILQQSSMQTLPMIRIIQSNNAMLVDKFYTIKNITLPAWKNQISLAISLQEQKNSVALATTIDDATNDLLKRNADLLHQNSVDTARANQRSVIDVETLEYVQNKLISTVSEVIEIHKQGQKNREDAQVKIKALQNNLNNLVIGN